MPSSPWRSRSRRAPVIPSVRRLGSAANVAAQSRTRRPVRADSFRPRRSPCPDADDPRARRLDPRPGRCARRPTRATWEARREAVRRWVRTGDPDAWPPPDDVELLVLYEQRIYRVLAARDRLAVAVLDRLDHPLAAEEGSNVPGGRRPVRPLLAGEDAARLPDPRPRTRRRCSCGTSRRASGGSGWTGSCSRP